MRPPPRVDERTVATIWERQLYDRAALLHAGLELVARGVPSDAGGPDYQDAMLVGPDGSLRQGDVELHVLASQWQAHGHHRNPRYNNVILHVVWRDDGARTVRQDGAEVPVVALSTHVTLPLAPPAPTHARLAPHPCTAVFVALSNEQLQAAVEACGNLRFAERRDSFAAQLDSLSPDQVLYTALLEGMGSASNRQAFRDLAEAVPVAWLLSQPAVQRSTVLLDAAGLGPPGGVALPGRLPPTIWRLARLRPGNHPAARIAGACDVLERLGPSPAESLLSLVADAERPVQLRAALMASPGGQPGIGAGRADELVASAVLPLAAALGLSEHRVRDLYCRYPAPPSTRWTRQMQDLFVQAGHRFTVRRAAHHQGIHYLYTRYCRREGPSDCPVCGRRSRMAPNQPICASDAVLAVRR